MDWILKSESCEMTCHKRFMYDTYGNLNEQDNTPCLFVILVYVLFPKEILQCS